MKQMTLATAGFERYGKTTRRGRFLPRWGGGAPGAGVGGLLGAGLSQAGQWPPAGRGRADAAHLFLAAMVQPVGPGGGKGALRFAGNAAFWGHRSRPRAGARRDDG